MNNAEQSPQEQALLSAAAEGDTEQVRQLLAQGAAVDCRNQYRQTPLMQAARGGHIETAELLLQRGAALEAADEWQMTPYLLACWEGQQAMIHFLLAAGANAYAVSEEDDRALYYAAWHDSPELVDLLAPFSDLPGEEWTGGGGSALARACHQGHMNAARRLLDWGISPNARGFSSSLANACRSGNLELVKLLLEKGADPLSVNDSGQHPIGSALLAKPFNPAIAELMLQLGNDINRGYQKWQIPLEEARQDGTPEAVAWALAHGAKDTAEGFGPHAAYRTYQAAQSGLESLRAWLEQNRERVDLDGALWMACTMHEAKPLECLLQAGADVNARFQYEHHATPLLCAWRAELVEVLLRYGAELNIGDDAGTTPLHHFMRMPWPGVTDVLPRINDAQIDRRDGEGKTPYLLACENGLTAAAPALAARGADTEARDSRGYTALHLAASYGHRDTMRMLLDAGADVNAAADDGFTPLLCAGDAESMRLLTEAGADEFHRAHSGWTALTTAIRTGRVEAVERVLLAGQRKDGRNVWLQEVRRMLGRRILKCCMRRTAQELCSHHPPIYETNLYENSARFVSSLTRACSRTDERAVAVLLEAGADVNARDKFTHRTPLFAACSPAGNALKPALVERLLEAGADVNTTDDCGQTPLHALSMLPDSSEKQLIRQRLLNAGGDAEQIDVFGKKPDDYSRRS